MNIRIAKKILWNLTDQARKPSAVWPYTDQQIIEAGRVYRRSMVRGVKAHPGADIVTLRFKWSASPASIPRRKRNGARRFGIEIGGAS